MALFIFFIRFLWAITAPYILPAAYIMELLSPKVGLSVHFSRERLCVDPRVWQSMAVCVVSATVFVLYTWLRYQVYVCWWFWWIVLYWTNIMDYITLWPYILEIILYWIYTYPWTLYYLIDIINITFIKVTEHYRFLLFGYQYRIKAHKS